MSKKRQGSNILDYFNFKRVATTDSEKSQEHITLPQPVVAPSESHCDARQQQDVDACNGNMQKTNQNFKFHHLIFRRIRILNSTIKLARFFLLENMSLIRKMLLLISRKINFLKILQIKREKIKKRFWVRKIYAERLQKGEFHLLVQDLRTTRNTFLSIFVCPQQLTKSCLRL